MKNKRLLVCSLITLIGGVEFGCDKRAKVGSDYELVQPQSFLMEPGRPECVLYYKGRKVWPSVLIDTPQSFRDGIYVFLASVPNQVDGSNYDVSINPQLFAIHDAGPPVIISQRLFNQPLKSNDWHWYRVEQMTPTSNGFSIKFAYEAEENARADSVTNLNISWAEIQSWLREAETSAPVRTTALGNYRTLQMTQTNRQ